MSMIDITKIVFPEDDSSGLQQKLFKIVDKYFENLSTHDLEEIYELQKNKNIKKYFADTLEKRYSTELEIDSSEVFGRLKEYISIVNMFDNGSLTITNENQKEHFTMKKRVLTQFLAKQNFKKIVKMYDVLIDDGSSYSHVYIPLFAPLIIEKVTEQESLETIKTACYPYNNHAKQLITEKIEEKLDIKFNFEE